LLQIPPLYLRLCRIRGKAGQGRSYGTFQRSLRLPYAVKSEQVRASFESGVLTVILPKTERQERSRRIQVQGRGATGETGEQQQATGASAPTDDTRSG
jgi:HSP20 family protein